MNKKEFLEKLEEHLIGISDEDKKEILEDYEEHFRVGKKNKRKDSEIAKALGDPKEIARQVRREMKEKDSVYFEESMLETWVEIKHQMKGVWKYIKKETPKLFEKTKEFFNSKEKKTKKKTKETKRSTWKIVLLILFNLFFMIWFLPTVFVVLLSLFIAGISISISGFAMIIASLVVMGVPAGVSLTNLFLSLMFAGFGVLFLGLLMSIVFYKLEKYFLRGVVKYLKFNKRIFVGGKK